MGTTVDPLTGQIIPVPGYPLMPAIDPIDDARWTRNVNWMSMPAMTGADEKFVGLVRVDNADYNLVALIASGNYTVDWGDGTVENISAGVTASHNYAWANAFLTDTSASLGYKQAMVVVTPQVGQQLTALNLNVKHPLGPSGATAVAAAKWLEMAISLPNCGASGLTIGVSAGMVSLNVFMEKAVVYNVGALTSLAYAFTNASSLRELYVSGISAVTTIANMCQLNSCLEKLIINDAASLTNANNLANNCPNIQELAINGVVGTYTAASVFSSCAGMIVAPDFDTSKISDASSMFSNGATLLRVPAYDFSSCTTFASMFVSCTSLQAVPRFKTTTALTSVSSMFSGCTALVYAPLIGDVTSAVTNWSSLFSNCDKLKFVPTYDMSAVTNVASMFSGCRLLLKVPPMNTANVTAFNSLFSGCVNLREFPTLNLASATTLNSMFQSCFQLRSVTLDLTTNNSCTASSLFLQCSALESVTITAAPKITDAGSMFGLCPRLHTITLPDLPQVASITSIFQSCLSLTNLTMGDAPLATNVSSIFQGCYNLSEIPMISSTAFTTCATAFASMSRLSEVPAWNVTSSTSFSNTFFLTGGLQRIGLLNIGATIDVSNQLLDAAAIAEIIGNLKPIMNGKTLTLTGNNGVDAAVTKTGIATTAKSLTINMANTSGLEVGMLATNATVWAGVSVTSSVSADTLTLTGHNIPDGTMVAFSALSTTTGVTIWTPYYVVNSTANTFQIALTPGGAPIDLTGTNATMTLRWFSKIASINTNVSITLDAPAPTTQTNQSISFRNLDTRLALCKGWTVTY